MSNIDKSIVETIDQSVERRLNDWFDISPAAVSILYHSFKKHDNIERLYSTHLIGKLHTDANISEAVEKIADAIISKYK